LTPPQLQEQLQFGSLYLSNFFLLSGHFLFSVSAFCFSSFCFTFASYAYSDVRIKNFSSKL